MLCGDSPFFYPYAFLHILMTGRNGRQSIPQITLNIFVTALCSILGMGFALPMNDTVFSTAGVTASTTLLLMSS